MSIDDLSELERTDDEPTRRQFLGAAAAAAALPGVSADTAPADTEEAPTDEEEYDPLAGFPREDRVRCRASDHAHLAYRALVRRDEPDVDESMTELETAMEILEREFDC
jgi:hypothetical protein